jgi:hypothetical protein
MFRQTIALVLTLLVVCQIGAVWTIFSTAIWIHQQNKAVRLSDQSRWEQFSLTAQQFESQLEGESEIEINDQLYDVVAIERVGAQVNIIAVADDAENKMRQTLIGLQKEETGWSQLAKRAQAFSFSAFYPEKSLEVFQQTSELQTVYFQYHDNHLCRGLQRLPEIPPAV